MTATSKHVRNTTIRLFAKPHFSQKKQNLQVSYYSINSLTKTLPNNRFCKTFSYTFSLSHRVSRQSISQNNALLNAVTLASGMVAVRDFQRKLNNMSISYFNVFKTCEPFWCLGRVKNGTVTWSTVHAVGQTARDRMLH